MYSVDAPTSRMMPISRRRANAASRIVLATSSRAATTRNSAVARAPHFSASMVP